MQNYFRLVYASRSRERETGRLAIEMGRILRSSRENNGRVGVGGVLYYGNGFYFQCLEGEERMVLETYKRIALDERHSDLNVLLRQKVSKKLFDRWSMKFVPTENAIQGFLKMEGLKLFTPFSFDERQVSKLLQYLTGPNTEEAVPKHSGWWHRLPLIGGLLAR